MKPIALAILLTISWSVAVFAQPASLDQAYDACVAEIKANLKPETTADKIALADRKKNQSSGDEFYFVWSWGSITGAIRERPDKLSGSMRPSASCIGSFAQRSLTYVTVNGTDVISRPKKF